MTWDVVVAGAGPAGALAGLLLARAGARVLVLDRARFPRPKLCGDTVNPGALAVLRRAGLERITADGLPIRGMLVTGEPDVAVTGFYPPGQVGISLRRTTLDARLVEAAASAGAVIQDGRLVHGPVLDEGGTRVIGVDAAGASTRRERLPARLVIAADGQHSRVARPLGLSANPRAPRRWATGAYFEGVRDVGDYGEMHIRARHYVGVAPIGSGVTNVCVVTADRERLRAADVFRAVTSDRLLGERFSGARMIEGPVRLGPLAVDASAAGMPGLLLAGDAAGFIDPMTGDGLRFAFQGAELAAAAALEALEHGGEDAHLRLAAARARAFRAKWRFNRTLRLLVERPASVRIAAAGARIAPWTIARAIRFAGDAG